MSDAIDEVSYKPMSLQTGVVITDEFNVTVNSDELICAAECLILLTRCRIN